MTVSALIRRLQSLPLDAEVYTTAGKDETLCATRIDSAALTFVRVPVKGKGAGVRPCVAVVLE